MKLSYVVLFSVFAGLSISNHITLRSIESSSSETMRVKKGSAARLVQQNDHHFSSSGSAGAHGGIKFGSQSMLIALREDLVSLKAQVSALQIKFQDKSQDGDENLVDDLHNDFVAKAEVEEAYREEMEVVEVEFSQEPTDQNWSFETQAVLQEALDTDESLLSALVGIKCRSQTCRVELTADDAGNLAEEIPLFILRISETLPNVRASYIDDGNGTQTTVLYMSSNLSDQPS